MRAWPFMLALAACSSAPPAGGPPDAGAAALVDAGVAPPPAAQQVNTMRSGTQYFPSIASDGAGLVWVTWYDYGSSPPGQYDAEVRLRAFDLAGVAQQPVELTANANTFGSQRYPGVAGGPDGVVVAWESRLPVEPPQATVMIRSFSSAGVAGQTPELDATLGAAEGYEKRPAVAVDPASGRFLVAWNERSLFIRRFERDGTPVDAAPVLAAIPWETRPDQPGLVAMWTSAVWLEDEGRFLVVFNLTDSSLPVPGASVFARRYPIDGDSPDRAPVALDLDAPGGDTYPAVAAFPGGGFVAVWTSYGGPGDGSSGHVAARRFANLDEPLDPVPLVVNTTTLDDQQSPRVAAGCGDLWLVTWNDWSRSTADRKLNTARARLWRRDGQPVDPLDWPIVDEPRETSLPVVTATPRGFAVAYEVLDAESSFDVWLKLIEPAGCSER